MQLKAVITNYQDSYDKYLQLSKDIQLLRNNSEAYKKEQELKIEELRQILQTYDTDKKIIETSEAERKIYDSPMVAQFHNLAKHIKRPTPNEWRKMEESMQVLMPGFMNFLSEHQSELTPQESHIMLLIKLQFITSEIYALMNLKAQRLTNIRSAINKKLFQMKGSPSLEQNINNIRIE